MEIMATTAQLNYIFISGLLSVVACWILNGCLDNKLMWANSGPFITFLQLILPTKNYYIFLNLSITDLLLK